LREIAASPGAVATQARFRNAPPKVHRELLDQGTAAKVFTDGSHRSDRRIPCLDSVGSASL